MARIKAAKHIHKYYKNNAGFWTCARPDCSHYLPTNFADKILTSRSICWKCKSEFLLNEFLIADTDKPFCQVCRYPEVTNLDFDSYMRHREIEKMKQDLKDKEEANKFVVRVMYKDGLRFLVDEKGNENLDPEQPIVSDSGLIINDDTE